MAERLSSDEKARLTTWIIDQHLSGDSTPTVTEETLDFAVSRSRIPTHDRAMRLLRFLTRQTRIVSEQVDLAVKYPQPGIQDGQSGVLVDTGKDGDTYNSLHLEAMAWTESTEHSEVFYLAGFLESQGLVTRNQVESPFQGPIDSFQVTVAGYRTIEELDSTIDSSQAFVAMWFDPTMDVVYERGIKPGIEDAGYEALRVDRKEHSNKIDDEIIAEIRRSRFLVADFTQGEGGARGGVYFEAGFAEGLGRRVIYTCRKDLVDDLSFDTRQYNHILWETPKELRISLKNRIGAVIGDGPNVKRTSTQV